MDITVTGFNVFVSCVGLVLSIVFIVLARLGEVKEKKFGIWYVLSIIAVLFTVLYMDGIGKGQMSIGLTKAVDGIYTGGEDARPKANDKEPPKDAADPLVYVVWKGEEIQRSEKKLPDGWLVCISLDDDAGKMGGSIVSTDNPVSVTGRAFVWVFMHPNEDLQKKQFRRSVGKKLERPAP